MTLSTTRLKSRRDAPYFAKPPLFGQPFPELRQNRPIFSPAGVIETHYNPAQSERAKGTIGGFVKIERPVGGERRRALTMLTEAGPQGQPHATLIANGFSRELLAAIIRGGQAVAVATVGRAGRRAVHFSYVQITDAGRQALSDSSAPQRRSIARRGLGRPVRPSADRDHSAD